MSLNATYSLGTSYEQQDNSQETDYTDDVVNLGAEGGEEEGVGEGYQEEGEEYTEDYSQDGNTEMHEDQMEYTEEQADDGYQDEVLDIQINEPLDGEFQVSSHICPLRRKHTHTHVLPLRFCQTPLCLRDNVSFLGTFRMENLFRWRRCL